VLTELIEIFSYFIKYEYIFIACEIFLDQDVSSNTALFRSQLVFNVITYAFEYKNRQIKGGNSASYFK
jgi:hypothetical protein